MVHGVILVWKSSNLWLMWSNSASFTISKTKILEPPKNKPPSQEERRKSPFATISWKGELLVLGEGVFGVPYLHLPLATPEWSNLYTVNRLLTPPGYTSNFRICFFKKMRMIMLAIWSQTWEKCHAFHCKFITKVCLTKRFFPQKTDMESEKSPLGKGPRRRK